MPEIETPEEYQQLQADIKAGANVPMEARQAMQRYQMANVLGAGRFENTSAIAREPGSGHAGVDAAMRKSAKGPTPFGGSLSGRPQAIPVGIPEEHAPVGKLGLGDLDLSAGWHDPSFEGFIRANKSELGGLDPETLASIQEHGTNSPEYKAWATQQWNQAAENAQAEGKTLRRVPGSILESHLPKGSGLAERAYEKLSQVDDAALGGSRSFLNGLVPGAGIVASKLMGDDAAEQARQAEERSPVASTAGMLVGGARGVLSKVAGGVYGGLTGLAGKVAPAIGGAGALAGRIGAAAASGAAGNVVQAAGKNAVSGALENDPSHQNLGDAATEGALLGGALHGVGEGAGAVAGAIERGKFGPGLRASAELGARPSATGFKVAPDSPLHELEAARVQGRLGSMADVAAERVAPKYVESGKAMTEGVNQQAANESSAMRESLVEPAPVPPAEPLGGQQKDSLFYGRNPLQNDPGAPELSPEHADAVDKFTYGYDKAIRRLQGGESPESIIAELKADKGRSSSWGTPEQFVAEAQGARKALEDALSSKGAPMPKAMFRGMNVSPEVAGKLAGHSFDLQGKTSSASFSPDIAENFAWSDGGGDPLVMKFEPGTKALPAGKYANELMGGEREAILPGDVKYRVKSRYYDESDPRLRYVVAEPAPPGYKDPTVNQRVSMKPVLEAVAQELSIPSVLPDANMRAVGQRIMQSPEMDVHEWEKFTGELDQLAKLNRDTGAPDERFARIAAAARQAAEGFPGLNEMRGKQAERFGENSRTMAHGGLPMRGKEVPAWNEMTSGEQKGVFNTLRKQTGDVDAGQSPGGASAAKITGNEPEPSTPMVRRAMDVIAKSGKLQAELDQIPKLESIDQLRVALRPHGLNVRLHPGGATAGAAAKALEFAELRGYPALKAAGSAPPEAEAVQRWISRAPHVRAMLQGMRAPKAPDKLGMDALAGRIGLKGGAAGARVAAAKDEITQEDLDNLIRIAKQRQPAEVSQ